MAREKPGVGGGFHNPFAEIGLRDNNACQRVSVIHPRLNKIQLSTKLIIISIHQLISFTQCLQNFNNLEAFIQKTIKWARHQLVLWNPGILTEDNKNLIN